jgi:alkyl hydroperoxide reductase subunit AhpC
MSSKKKNHDAAIISAINKLDALVVKRELWQVKYELSNQGLFDLLAECLGTHDSIKGKPSERAVIASIKEVLEAKGLTINPHTTVLCLIVRYVFGVKKSKRIDSYHRALTIALKSNVTKNTFAQWVSDFGGIEEVVLEKGVDSEAVEKQEALDEEKEEVKEMLSDMLNDPDLIIFPKSEFEDDTDTGEFTLLIGKTVRGGEVKVLSVVPNSTGKMIKAAIDCIAKAQLKQQEKEFKAAFRRKADEAKNDAVNEALANDFPDSLAA